MEETEEPQLVSSDYDVKQKVKEESRVEEKGEEQEGRNSANGEKSQFTEVPLTGKFSSADDEKKTRIGKAVH